ncbi:TVP38/TMEM64 family protein [Isachenkonia alkalipeptolytica]|uniref:TVP38/TMEM64 family membrane protein n=1 Tax=Isachenkonia alkalipeptolytica TaxID=2565777 RepID=A0AA43XNG7_9CLOT|nr:VTT domain-containing protein [Isachenkonia alkalipeptolytica]NBG89090.1 TVP38/TMEM64 family protein [Isachenkonia alkalipeptolytica]
MTGKNRSIGIIAGVMIFFVLYLIDRLGIIGIQPDVDSIRALIEEGGMWSIIVFLFICMFRQLFFLPTTVVYISGGLIFGPLLGSLYSVTGHTVNIFLAYVVGLRFKESIRRFISVKYVEKLRKAKKQGSFKPLFAMRVTPGFPVDPISFGAGFVEMNFNIYFLASVLGSVPKIVVYSYLGQRLENIFAMETILALGSLLILALIPYLFKNGQEAL